MRTNAALLAEQQTASITSYLPLQWRHAVCGQVTSVDGAQFTDSLADFNGPQGAKG